MILLAMNVDVIRQHLPTFSFESTANSVGRGGCFGGDTVFDPFTRQTSKHEPNRESGDDNAMPATCAERKLLSWLACHVDGRQEILCQLQPGV